MVDVKSRVTCLVTFLSQGTIIFQKPSFSYTEHILLLLSGRNISSIDTIASTVKLFHVKPDFLHLNNIKPHTFIHINTHISTSLTHKKEREKNEIKIQMKLVYEQKINK